MCELLSDWLQRQTRFYDHCLNDVVCYWLTSRLEFGNQGDQIYVGDEISPDTCRIWDKKTNRKLDKDRVLQDLGGVEKAYRELFDRLTSAM